MQVDFLPESFRQARRRRGRLIRQVALVGSIAGCLALATVALKTHSHHQRGTAERLEDTVKSEQNALTVLSGLNQQQRQLIDTFDLKQELQPQVRYTQVITELGHALPEGVAVVELALRSVRPKPEPMGSDKPSGRRESDAEKPRDYEPNVIGVEMQGLAPDDLSVARLVSALDEHPLFSRVTMRSSQAVTMRDLIARKFSLTATVDLDRDVRWVTPTAMEVAHVDE